MEKNNNKLCSSFISGIGQLTYVVGREDGPKKKGLSASSLLSIKLSWPVGLVISLGRQNYVFSYSSTI